MGRGKRVLKWIKSHLFGKKRLFRNKSKKSKGAGSDESTAASTIGDEVENCYVDIRASFSDVSISLPRELSLTGLLATQPEATGCNVPNSTGYSDVHLSMDDTMESSKPWLPPSMMLGGGDHGTILKDSYANHRLPPIEEEYRQANIKPAILPEPCITISNFGNVAFEVDFAQEERPPTARSMPKRFSVMSNYADREDRGSNWEEKMKRTESNRQAALKNRCDALKKRSERAKSVRQRKASDLRPHIHAGSLLQELAGQDHTDTTTPAPSNTIGGTAAGRGGVAFEVFLPEQDRPSTASMPDRFSACLPVDKKPLAHGWDARMERKNLGRQFHLLKRRQDIWSKEGRDAKVRQRKNITSVRPAIHGESLLSELPQTPDVGSRSVSRGGIAFEVATTSNAVTPRPTTARLRAEEVSNKHLYCSIIIIMFLCAIFHPLPFIASMHYQLFVPKKLFTPPFLNVFLY